MEGWEERDARDERESRERLGEMRGKLNWSRAKILESGNLLLEQNLKCTSLKFCFPPALNFGRKKLPPILGGKNCHRFLLLLLLLLLLLF